MATRTGNETDFKQHDALSSLESDKNIFIAFTFKPKFAQYVELSSYTK